MLSESSLRRDFIRALTGSSGIYLFGTFMGLLVGIQLARGLGVAGYGLYGSAMAAAALGATLASGGIQLHATREIAASRARGDAPGASQLLKWSFRTLVLLALPTSVFVGAYVWWGQGASLSLAVAAMFVTVLMAILALVGAVVRGSGAVVLGQAIDAAIRPTIQSILLMAGILILGSLDPGLALAVAALSMLAAMPAGLMAIVKIWKGEGPTVRLVPIESRKSWSRSATTMGLTTVIRAAENALPLILVGILSSLEQAGLYRVAASAMVLPSMAGTMISVMVPAMAARLYERKEMRRLQNLSAASCFAVLIPTIGAAVVLWYLGEPLLKLAFGADYVAAWLPLVVLTLSTVVAACGGIGVTLLHVAHRESAVTRAFAVSLAISAAGTLVLAPNHGAGGVAFSILLAVTVRTAMLSWDSWRHLRIDPTVLGAALNRIRSLQEKDSA